VKKDRLSNGRASASFERLEPGLTGRFQITQMDNRKYIGMDVHQASISIAVSDGAGKVRSPQPQQLGVLVGAHAASLTQRSTSRLSRSQEMWLRWLRRDNARHHTQLSRHRKRWSRGKLPGTAWYR